jgi:hypothetical protein
MIYGDLVEQDIDKSDLRQPSWIIERVESDYAIK